jgi:chromosome segregation ATPase
MNVFRRLFEHKESDSARFDRIEAKIRVLDDDLDKQIRQNKALHLEWEQTYDKLAHLMARITKRRAALEREQQALEEAPQPSGTTNRQPAGLSPIIGTHDDLLEMRRRNGLLPR